MSAPLESPPDIATLRERLLQQTPTSQRGLAGLTAMANKVGHRQMSLPPATIEGMPILWSLAYKRLHCLTRNIPVGTCGGGERSTVQSRECRW